MNFKHLYWRAQSKYYKIWGSLLCWLPVSRNKIVFNNFRGHGYGDSPKYIAEEIIRQGLKYDMVWLVDDENMEFPSEVRKVSLASIRTSYELSTAKVIISNVKVSLPYHKKKNQYYIQTWHGSMSFKYIEKDAKEKLRPQYLKETMADSQLIDLFLSCNSIQTQEIQTSFWYDGEIFECGSPRNDMYYKPVQFKNRVKMNLGVASETKLVLYAPTFRDDYRTDVYDLDLTALQKTLTDRFGGDWMVLVRLHPNVRENNVVNICQNSIDVTSYPDMQELLLISDVLITDYSSTIYDAAIMRKTVFLYAPDLEDYNVGRGLKPFYYTLPTCITKTNDELFENISKFDETGYQRRLEEFLATFRVFDDGNASKRVVEKINAITKLSRK
jgi:CDP-glycerol glycerophosphotransferase